MTIDRKDGTARDALAIFALVGGTAAAAWLVPTDAWGDLVDPTARVAVLMVVLVVLLLSLRSARAVLWEWRALCVLLAVMPLTYIESGVVRGAGSWLAVEAIGLVIFAGWAWLGYRREPWILALGIATHGLAWDSWHHDSHYMPSWYASACLYVDLGAAAYVLLQRERLAGASRSAPVVNTSYT